MLYKRSGITSKFTVCKGTTDSPLSFEQFAHGQGDKLVEFCLGASSPRGKRGCSSIANLSFCTIQGNSPICKEQRRMPQTPVHSTNNENIRRLKRVRPATRCRAGY